MRVSNTRHLLLAACLGSLGALSACGGSDTASDSARSPEIEGTEPATAFITGTASGAVDSQFALDGIFKCQDNALAGGEITTEIIGTGDQGEQLAIFLPYSQETGVGSHDLIGTDDEPTLMTNRREIRYRAPGRDSYDTGTGALTISEWPEQGGESVVGSFRASLSNPDGEVVELEGTINGTSLRDFDCTG